ncbi:alpha-amylase [Deminuibacter soli]|uniref:Alpha-amylase n=1 Tax=Deminuibacter soli TaxID=2291815 RepID=A0A3E1NCJ7_9BACT|nr:alpha-amylase [Deminuibacter soli]
MNGTILQYFHWYYPSDGSLWKKLQQDIPYLQQLGITAVWLPPAYKGADGGHASGYDTYDLFDLGEFDQKGSVRTKFGTKDEFIAATDACNKAGIAVYVDVVINHKAGADEREKVKVIKVNPDNRTETISEPFEIEAYTKFTFPGRKGKYSEFIWDFHCFTGVDHAADLNEDGIFNIMNEYGDTWEEVISNEFGNYDYLMHADIEFRNPAVREEIKYWTKWFYDTAHFHGMRLDAVKHISPAFFNEWLDYVGANLPDQFMVGEFWTGNVSEIETFIAATGGRMNMFDAPLQYQFHRASKEGNSFDLTTIFDDTLLAHNAPLAVTLVSNHDTQPLQSLEAPVEPWFEPLAYALILLRREGYPCVFYPDLFGAEYTDKGNDGNDYTITLPAVEKIELLLKARKDYAHGDQYDYIDHPNCIGWARSGDAEHPGGCVVIMSNSEEGFKDIDLGKDRAGTVFVDFLGNKEGEITLDEHGHGRFIAPAGNVSVWVVKA